MNVIALKTFEKDYLKADKAQQERILCLVKRIREQGIDAMKFLRPMGQYVIAEAKSKNPPYRLYIIMDKATNTAYLVSWVHKDKQRSEIAKLEGLFEKGFKEGLEYFLKSNSTNSSLD
jgi:mRNA-degrading endonuclease RelE of RelBE toxin-antitoxin system